MKVSSAAVMTSVLAEGRLQREKAAQDRAAARLRDAKSALATLKQTTSDASEQRKAAAKQRVDQIKARLQMLKMSPPVDPKVLAQLARELKAAVKSYAGAGGDVGDLGAATTPAADAPPSNEASAGEAASVAKAEATADTAPTTSPSDQGDGRQANAEDKDGRADEASEKADADPYRRMAQEASAKSIEASRRGAANQADRDFLNDVRNLAGQLKTLAKQAMSSKADPSRNREAEGADRAAFEAVKAAQDASRDLAVGNVSLTV